MATYEFLDQTGLEELVLNIDNKYARAAIKACYDENTALYAHLVDDIIYLNSHFYKVTAAIAVGDTITVGTNVTANTGIKEDSAIYVENLPNNAAGGNVQVDVLPTASAGELGHIYQYVGNDTESLTNGYFYKCVTTSGSYEWEQIDVQPGSSGGSGFENCETEFSQSGSVITETYDDRIKTTTFNQNGTITETLADLEGIVYQTKVTTFNQDGSISEVVTDS